MSIINIEEVKAGSDAKRVQAVLMRAPVNKKGEPEAEMAEYTMTPDEEAVYGMILKHFVLASTNMYTPRVEFNDLSLILRDQYDQMSFNTYQPNNGEAWEGNPQGAWRSRAMRPVVRNKPHLPQDIRLQRAG